MPAGLSNLWNYFSTSGTCQLDLIILWATALLKANASRTSWSFGKCYCSLSATRNFLNETSFDSCVITKSNQRLNYRMVFYIGVVVVYLFHERPDHHHIMCNQVHPLASWISAEQAWERLADVEAEIDQDGNNENPAQQRPYRFWQMNFQGNMQKISSTQADLGDKSDKLPKTWLSASLANKTGAWRLWVAPRCKTHHCSQAEASRNVCESYSTV